MLLTACAHVWGCSGQVWSRADDAPHSPQCAVVLWPANLWRERSLQLFSGGMESGKRWDTTQSQWKSRNEAKSPINDVSKKDQGSRAHKDYVWKRFNCVPTKQSTATNIDITTTGSLDKKRKKDRWESVWDVLPERSKNSKRTHTDKYMMDTLSEW
jgi:hypothetical protein